MWACKVSDQYQEDWKPSLRHEVILLARVFDTDVQLVVRCHCLKIACIEGIRYARADR